MTLTETGPDQAQMEYLNGVCTLQVLPALESGGAERTTLEIARGIIAAGGRAVVVSRGGRLVADLEAAGARHVTAPVHSKNPFVMARNADRLARLIREEGAAIIHARSRAPAWSAYFAARRERIPFVTTFHGAYRDRSAFKRLYNSSMIRSNAVIANSRFTAERITAAYPSAAGRIVTIPRGADLDVFSPSPAIDVRAHALRESWRAGPETRVLLLPARVTGWKGHIVAIEALAHLTNNSPQPAAGETGARRDLRLVFCGESQSAALESELRRLADSRGVNRMIAWVGHCADMPAAYRAADLVLAPSTRPEAFGRTAVEAGAMERIAISADHGGAQETVIDGETGFLVAPGDDAALAATIGMALGLAAERRVAMEKAARARVASEYSTRSMVEATLSTYARLVTA